MLAELLAHRTAEMAGEVVGNDVQVAVGIVLFNDIEQSDKPSGVARCRGHCAFDAVTHAQGAVDPHVLRTSPIIGCQRRLANNPAGDDGEVTHHLDNNSLGSKVHRRQHLPVYH
jgi:hypothetical protein